MASSDSVELYQPCSRGGGTAPFGFKTRRDIFRIARPFPRPKCPHRSPVYSAVYTRAFPHSSESYKRYRPRRERFLETVYDCRDDVRFSFNGSGQRPATRTTRRKNCIKRASYIRFGIGRNCCTFPPNRFLPIKLHAPPTPYFEMYLRRTCSGIVNNLSSRASPCFDPFKCLLTRSVELQ